MRIEEYYEIDVESFWKQEGSNSRAVLLWKAGFSIHDFMNAEIVIGEYTSLHGEIDEESECNISESSKELDWLFELASFANDKAIDLLIREYRELRGI